MNKHVIRTSLILILFLSFVKISAQQFNEKIFAARRSKLCEKIQDGLLLMYGGESVIRNGDIDYEFRQNSDFYYLTGLEEPGAIMILSPDADKKFVLFLEQKLFYQKLFDGEGTTIENAMTQLGADTAYTIDEFDEVFKKYSKGIKKLYYDLKNGNFNSTFLAKVQHPGFKMPEEVINPDNMIHELRVIKDKPEIELLSRAINITCESIAEAMKTAEPGKTESELHGIIEYVWRKGGVRRYGYPSIIASGENTAIYHYCKNNDIISDGDLIMMDIGCEYEYYSADVTRTFPANGKFSKEQKELYSIALASLQTAIDSIKPGIGFHEINQITIDVIAEGLYNLGLITDKEKKWQISTYYSFYFGHFLGLDTHDVGDYLGNSPKGRILEPGMIIAVEPGIYINLEYFNMLQEFRKYFSGVTEQEVKDFIDAVGPQVEKYANICVRAEDDILITEDGNINLSEKLPKSIEGIEKLMKEKSIFN